jgi:hypothetical protein
VPEPIWEKLAELFPDITFKTVFFEESWMFAGEGVFNEAGKPNGLVYYKPNPKEKKWRDFYESVYDRPYLAWDDEETDEQAGG